MEKQKMEMDIINPRCAGIDIGSRSHFVAIGQQLTDVKEFGVIANDLTTISLQLQKRTYRCCKCYCAKTSCNYLEHDCKKNAL